MKRIMRSSGYWTRPENIVVELNRVRNELGEPPTSDYLKAHEKSLFNAIYEYHGGLIEAEKLAGYTSNKRSNHAYDKPIGYFKNPDNMSKEIDRVTQTQGTFSIGLLARIGEWQLWKAIRSNPEVYAAVKKDHIYSNRKSTRHWRDWCNIERYIEDAEKKNGHFPTSRELQKMGGFGLSRAITRYHGGIAACREKYYDTHLLSVDKLENLLQGYINLLPSVEEPNE